MNNVLARDLLVQIDEGGGRYRALAGLRARRFDLAASPAERVQFTAHRWRKFQPASGALSMRLAGDGMLVSATGPHLLQQLFIEGGVAALRIIVPDFGSFSGAFLVTELAYEAREDDIVNWRLAVQSNGEVSFAVA